MSQPDPSARPSQVTVAGWAVAVASAVLVLAVFDTMTKLETVDMRDRLSQVISSGSAKSLGFTVADAIDVLRWCLYVSGVAAAASAILGVFVLQGHRGARIGVTVSAVAIVLTASVAGSFTAFLAMFIGVGTGMLWTRPARDWFAGRPITVPASARPAERREQPEPPKPVAWLPPASGDAQPPPTPGWGRAPETSAESAASWPAPTGWPVVAPVERRTPLDSPRPSQVRLACILTWVLSSLTAVGYALVLVVLAVDKSRFVEELKKSPGWKSSYDVDTVTTAVTVAAIVFVIWSVCAVVLAVLVWRRTRWAWVALLVSAWAAGLVSVLAFPFSLPYLAVIGASTGMLMRAPSRAWFTRASQLGPPQPPAPRPPVW